MALQIGANGTARTDGVIDIPVNFSDLLTNAGTTAVIDASTLRVVEVDDAGVGAVSERDIQFAEASNAIVLGFHVRPDNAARKAAEKAGVDVRVYQIIYELLDEVRAAMAGLLAPTFKENFLGRAEVRETFTIPKIGTIAGSYVTDGQLKRSASCRLVRDGVQVYEGKFGSLRRFKDDVRNVQSGFECGIGIDSSTRIDSCSTVWPIPSPGMLTTVCSAIARYPDPRPVPLAVNVGGPQPPLSRAPTVAAPGFRPLGEPLTAFSAQPAVSSAARELP